MNDFYRPRALVLIIMLDEARDIRGRIDTCSPFSGSLSTRG